MGQKPVTPLVGCDVFVVNEKREVLLVKRADNGFWCLPGGCQNLGESPKEGAERECFEESGYRVRVTSLLGVWSSRCYRYVNYPWKDNEFAHLVYTAELVGGEGRPSDETPDFGWFPEDRIPPLSDGHDVRIARGYARLRDPSLPAHFE